MGIVKTQALGNSLFSYIGIGIGYVNVVLLFPRIFDTDQFGLTRVILAIGVVFMQFAQLGAPSIVVRFFPFFRERGSDRSGFLVLCLVVPLIGFIVIGALFLLSRDLIVSHFQDQSTLFRDNYHYVLPMAFFGLYFAVLENLLLGNLDTVFSNFLRNVVLRVVWMADILLFHAGAIDFDTFMFGFIYAHGLILLILLGYYLKRIGIAGEAPPQWPSRGKSGEMLKYGLFSFLSGVSYTLVARIDVIMIGFFLGLTETAVYSVAVYIGTLVYVPAQGILRITYPLVANHWKNKDLAQIAEVCRQSSINGLILGGIILLCVATNLTAITSVLPAEYGSAGFVIVLYGLAKLADMAGGANGLIIVTSEHYRVDTLFGSSLVFLVVGTNYLLIPIFGIEGAAVATLISIVAYNLARFLFVKIKFGMQPFGWKSVTALVLLGGVYGAMLFVPHADHFMVDAILRCALVTGGTIPAAYFLGISPEINESIDNTLKKLGR